MNEKSKRVANERIAMATCMNDGHTDIDGNNDGDNNGDNIADHDESRHCR